MIAGVVGASKPTYDIWGDTVNVASRLESSGILGRIQVSEQVAQSLSKEGHFEVECRGPIEVKGKGRLTTYLVVTPYDSLPDESLTSAAAAAAAGSVPLATDGIDNDNDNESVFVGGIGFGSTNDDDSLDTNEDDELKVAADDADDKVDYDDDDDEVITHLEEAPMEGGNEVPTIETIEQVDDRKLK